MTHKFPLFLCIITLCCILTGCFNQTGSTTINGTYVRTGQNENVLINDDTDNTYRYILMNEHPHYDASFDDLETGDRIEIEIVLIEETGRMPTTNVLSVKKSIFPTEISEEILREIESLLTETTVTEATES